MRTIFAEADNSMEEMMNSSISHLEEVFDRRGKEKAFGENSELIEQNQQLKEAVQELMMILRTKLDKALQKQEQELQGMLKDYLQLITKLLEDKENLTNNLEVSGEEMNKVKKEMEKLQG